MDGRRLLGYLSDFWSDHFADTDVLETLFDGYIEVVRQRYAELHRLGLSHSLELHPGAVTDLWQRFDFSAGGGVQSLPADVLQIPRLQDRFTQPALTLHEGVDFALEPGQIRFLTTIPTRPLWAPVVFRADDSVWTGLGAALGLSPQDLPSVADTRQALRILRAIWHASHKGPTLQSLHIGANAVAGLPFADHPGRVTAVTGQELAEKTVELTWGDTGAGVVGALGDRLIAGTLAFASSTGFTDASGAWLYDKSSTGALPGDYVCLLSPDERTDARVLQVHEVTPQTILPERSTGSTDSTGRRLADPTAGDLAAAQPGDLVHVIQPVTRAGHYRIRQVSAGALELEERLAADLANVRYRVVRRPGVCLSQAAGRRRSGLTWRLVRPGKAWPLGVWEQQIVWDALGRQFLVLDNDESSLRLRRPADEAPPSSWIQDGPFRLRPPHETRPGASYRLAAVLTPTVQPGDVVGRFQPLSDGIRLTDWRSTQRQRRYARPLFALGADTDGGDVLRLDTTAGIARGDTFEVVDGDTPPTQVRVVDVLSAEHVRVDRDVPAGYTVQRLGRFRPCRTDVEGLSGFGQITEARNAGATDGIDGRLFQDDGATFQSDQVLPEDRLRIIQADGTLEWATIAAVISQTQLRLTTDIGPGRTDIYYHVVVLHAATDYFRLSVLMAADVSRDRRDAIEAFLQRLKPGYLAIALSPLVQDVYESDRVRQVFPVLLHWAAQDPPASGSRTGQEDLTSLSFQSATLQPMASDTPPRHHRAFAESVGGNTCLTGGPGRLGEVFHTAARSSVDNYATFQGSLYWTDIPRPTDLLLPSQARVRAVVARRLPSRTGSAHRTGAGFHTGSPGALTRELPCDYVLLPT